MVVLTGLAVSTPRPGSTDCAAWVADAQQAYDAAAATIAGVPLSDVWSTCSLVPGNSSGTQGSAVRAAASAAKAAVATQLLVQLYVRVPSLALAVATQARMASQVSDGGFQRQVAAAGGASAARYVAKAADSGKPACIVGVNCGVNATVFGDPHIRRGAEEHGLPNCCYHGVDAHAVHYLAADMKAWQEWSPAATHTTCTGTSWERPAPTRASPAARWWR